MTNNEPNQWLILLLVAVFFAVSATAQNNPYKIDDELYELYIGAQKVRYSPNVLPLYETMRSKAIRKHDLKAECLSMSLPISYYQRIGNHDSLLIAVEAMKEVSRRNGYLQYYYYAAGEYITYMLNSGQTLRALQLSNEMKQQADADRNTYGFYKCLRMQANIYLIRNNPSLAKEVLLAALEYMQTYLPEQEASGIYVQLARIENSSPTDREASLRRSIQYAEQAIASSKTPTSRLIALCEKGISLYGLKRYDRFMAYTDSIMPEIDFHENLGNSYATTIQLYRCILKKDFDGARRLAATMQNKGARLSLNAEIYSKQGDYELAFRYANLYTDYKDSVNQQIQSADLAETNVQLDNARIRQDAQRLKMDNMELSLNNTRLNLQNTQLELDRMKTQSDLHQIHIMNDSLQLLNQSLELQRLQSEAERQQMLLKEEQTAGRMRTAFFIIILLFTLTLSGLLYYHLRRNQRMTGLLRRKNEELTVARDHAEQSDQMKMRFIQNMSHEIRTPLNAIVGFSQILTLPDMELDDDEKQEYATLIQQNSDLLTTLVNDVLDLASLESGKYTMHLAPHPCNEICRMALSSVSHRKPAGVELRFTTDVPDDYLLLTDNSRLRQVLINFLTNAEKYTSEGEILLHCSLTEVPGHVAFSVTDTGTGIPADQAENVFQRFKKLDDFKQGTGLGLNICRLIAERLHGNVYVDTSYTKGARFVFVHPLG